ncbi:MAG: hypothetical protein QOE14_2665, partial [Humisphaera sp.]|nr:hypothetical protein [Humisphaera sp.]
MNHLCPSVFIRGSLCFDGVTMNIGIIGLGMMGRTHYEAYQEIGATVVAVADQDPKRASGDLTGTAGNVIE